MVGVASVAYPYTHCVHCTGPLPPQRRADMKFCTGSCMKKAARAREGATLKRARASRCPAVDGEPSNAASPVAESTELAEARAQIKALEGDVSRLKQQACIDQELAAGKLQSATEAAEELRLKLTASSAKAEDSADRVATDARERMGSGAAGLVGGREPAQERALALAPVGAR